MKKTLFLIASMFLCLVGNVKADDNISASLKVDADLTTATLHVNLTNSVNYVAFQMDVTLPDGWTVTAVDPVLTDRLAGGEDVTIGDVSQSTKFQLPYNILNDNVVRIIGYNLGNVAISGTSGDELFSIKLTKTAGEATDVTSWTGTFSDVQFVTATDLAGITMAVAQNPITGSLIGDINSDGEVNLNDLICLVKILQVGENDSACADYDKVAADLNQDGEINLNDLVALIAKL